MQAGLARHHRHTCSRTFGNDPAQWAWGQAHTLTHNHPLGQQKPLDKLFNVGPVRGAGRARDAQQPGHQHRPRALGGDLRAVDPARDRLCRPRARPLGINPVGQSGVLFDAHYRDQAKTFITGGYVPQHLKAEDVKANARSRLSLTPAR